MEKDRTRFQETPEAFAERMWASFRSFEQAEKTKLPKTTGIEGNIKEGTTFLTKWGAGIVAALVTFLVVGGIFASLSTSLPALVSGLLAILTLILPFVVLFKVKNATEDKIRLGQSNKRSAIDATIQQKRDETTAAINQYSSEYSAYKAEEERKKAEERARALSEKRRQEEIAAMQKDKELKARIVREETEADTKMSNSGLVVEIAKCILPFFKRIIDQADRESHMKVRVRLGIKVNKDSIEYYDVSSPQNVSLFSFSEEGISDRLSPIYRKALCKALVTELRRLLFETYSTDSSGQKIQIGLEGTVTLVSQIQYIPGRDYTAPEYDDKSFATAVLLYETFEQKAERHF